MDPLDHATAVVRAAREVQQQGEQDLLTVKEYAAALRVHEQTVRAWIRGGKLPAERTSGNGRWRIRKDARAA